MIAKQLISDSLVHLKSSDSVDQALAIMHINYVKHLPIVIDGKLEGVASEEQLLRLDSEVLLSTLLVNGAPISAKADDHLFEVLGTLAEHKLTSIPIVDTENNFVGIVSQEDLIHFYANSFSFKEPGSIIVLEVSKRDYSLAEISRIVELESASILSTFLSEIEDNSQILVTLKINRNDIAGIIKALERYEFIVKASFAEAEYIDDLKERYDMLMSYLNV